MKKGKTQNSIKKGPSSFERAITEAVNEIFKLAFKSLEDFIQVYIRNWVVWTTVFVWLFLTCRWVAVNNYHLELLHLLGPELFTVERLRWTYRYDLDVHIAFTYIAVVLPLMLFAGMFSGFGGSKFERMFKEMGLTTASGLVPKLVWMKKLNYDRTLYDFDGKGISKHDFEQKKSQFEAQIKQEIESIFTGDHPGRIRVITTLQRLPNKISYSEFAGKCTLEKESFYVGSSTKGPIQQSIDELPHMLIAGSTGNGKSNFFKQVIRCLLESSPYIQVYAIDLKGGLEMVDFRVCPNVKVIKSINEAVSVLRQLKIEMERRFEFLEKNSLKSIKPERDGMDRIIACFDEASVLYMKRHRNDSEYHKALEARQLTDAIAKLSRAAKINLIFATQKLTKEVLPTSITENVSGRMCFRTESIPGSLLVLNTRDAADLPEFKGRGIWSYGSSPVVTQTPMLSEHAIRDFSKRIAEEFKNGVRKCLTPMLGVKAKNKSKKNQETLKNAQTKTADANKPPSDTKSEAAL